jgi:hypothetical protein
MMRSNLTLRSTFLIGYRLKRSCCNTTFLPELYALKPAQRGCSAHSNFALVYTSFAPCMNSLISIRGTAGPPRRSGRSGGSSGRLLLITIRLSLGWGEDNAGRTYCRRLGGGASCRVVVVIFVPLHVRVLTPNGNVGACA